MIKCLNLSAETGTLLFLVVSFVRSCWGFQFFVVLDTTLFPPLSLAIKKVLHLF